MPPAVLDPGTQVGSLSGKGGHTWAWEAEEAVGATSLSSKNLEGW